MTVVTVVTVVTVATVVTVVTVMTSDGIGLRIPEIAPNSFFCVNGSEMTQKFCF